MSNVGAPYRLAGGKPAKEVSSSAREARAGSASPTAALHDLYARESGDLAAFSRAFRFPVGENGLAVGIGGKLVALEVFDAPETLAPQWHRLVEGVAQSQRVPRSTRKLSALLLAPADRGQFRGHVSNGRRRNARVGAIHAGKGGADTRI